MQVRVILLLVLFLGCGNLLATTNEDVYMNDRIREAVINGDYAILHDYLDELNRHWYEDYSLGYYDSLDELIYALTSLDDLSLETQRFIIDVARQAIEKKSTKEIQNYQLLARQKKFIRLLLSEAIISNQYLDKTGSDATDVVMNYHSKINMAKKVMEALDKKPSKPGPILAGKSGKAGDVPIGGTSDSNDIKDDGLREIYASEIEKIDNDLKVVIDAREANRIYLEMERVLSAYLGRLRENKVFTEEQIGEILHNAHFSSAFINENKGK